MVIGQIPAPPEYIFLAYSGVQRPVFDNFFFLLDTSSFGWPPPLFVFFFFFFFTFVLLYVCTFLHLYVCKFFCSDVQKKERKNIQTKKCLFVRSFVLLFVFTNELTVSSISLSLSPVMDPTINWDGFQNHLKTCLVNGDPQMVIGGCISPSPTPLQEMPLVNPTTGSGRWQRLVVTYRSYKAGLTKRPLS